MLVMTLLFHYYVFHVLFPHSYIYLYPAHYEAMLPTLIKMGCYITLLGHHTFLVIKTLQGEALVTRKV